MTTVYVIDTHALLWFLAGMAQLGVNAKAILQNPASRLILSVTALAEACWIVGRGKVPLNVADILAALTPTLALPSTRWIAPL